MPEQLHSLGSLKPAEEAGREHMLWSLVYSLHFGDATVSLTLVLLTQLPDLCPVPGITLELIQDWDSLCDCAFDASVSKAPS